MKKFKYSLDNKRYHTLNYHLKEKYGKKTFKVSLNANFSCPNKINGYGCIFCSKLGSGDFAGNKSEDLITQFNNVKNMMEKKWKDAYYIGYFQANTNTYAPLNILKEKYESILKIPNVVGLDIATRCDAISDEVLDYLEQLNKKTNLVIELGLQSIHEKTLKLINRGHNLECFDNMVKKLKKRNIEVVVHIINGLPFETKKMMVDTVKHLNSLNIDGIKIHMLSVLKNTPLANYYEKHKFKILTKEEYIDIVCTQLQYLNEKIIIHRITGDPKIDDLITPHWLTKKFCVLNDIDKYMKMHNIYQGDKAD